MARVPYLDKSDLAPENHDLLKRTITLHRALVHSPNAARAFGGLGQFIRHKSFCLLETCPDQWAENNRRSGHNYSPQLLGTREDPFNVFEGTPLMNGSIEGSTTAKQMHKARIGAQQPLV